MPVLVVQVWWRDFVKLSDIHHFIFIQFESSKFDVLKCPKRFL